MDDRSRTEIHRSLRIGCYRTPSVRTGPVPAQQDMPLSGCAFDQLRLIYRASFVPVPPLPIQEEIVAILDRFESLVSDLKDGLPAEITARHKQYEHYRNQLLTPFNSPSEEGVKHRQPLNRGLL